METLSKSEPRPVENAEVMSAVRLACTSIAPAWPLDRVIAVNPFWSRIDRPFPEVAAHLRALSGARLLMQRAWYREKWDSGEIKAEHLRAAAEEQGVNFQLERFLSPVESDRSSEARMCTILDVVDGRRDLSHQVSWRSFVVHNISQFSAAYFDEGQSQMHPDPSEGFYAAWRKQALNDRSARLLMRFRSFQELAKTLPVASESLIQRALVDMDVPKPAWQPYLTALLLDVNGWASWCAYRRWIAVPNQREEHHLEDLLAVRLAWEWLLYQAGGESLRPRWQMAMATWPSLELRARASQADDWVWQRALEMAYQEALCFELPKGTRRERVVEPAVQAVFCIDVRSEVLRRALERESPRVQTLGFAGFFGLPMDYLPTGSDSARPQLPGLLTPRLRVSDTGLSPDAVDRRVQRLEDEAGWKKFKSSAVSGFSFVESMGLFAGIKLSREILGLSRPVPEADQLGLSKQQNVERKPRLVGTVPDSANPGRALTMDERADLGAKILRSMSLTHGFAGIVLLVGHRAQVVNNPHAASLDCGACCGQSGEVNARAVASLLNEEGVRSGLKARGIDVPDSTRFVAGLHNTTTEEVELFDLDELPADHQAELQMLSGWLRGASDRARHERAPSMGLRAIDANPRKLKKAFTERSKDVSEIRPEWGLVNNAALIVAPREHSAHLNLEGRAFLHEYRWEEDEGFQTLELIMTAPMVVAHWINLQYYASTVDNLRYGSGNKVLHNVVGGHIGVFEGNGGDLRIGLAKQSLHDGDRWIHTPLRLSVFIEAPGDAIEQVLRSHEKVRHLVENNWLFLFQIDLKEGRTKAYREGHWVRACASPAH